MVALRQLLVDALRGEGDHHCPEDVALCYRLLPPGVAFAPQPE
jgi:hypothetical protein